MLELIDGRDQGAPVHVARPARAGRWANPEDDVSVIVDGVRGRGDAALLAFTNRFDNVRLTSERLLVEPEVIARAEKLVRPELIAALKALGARLTRTCKRQLPSGWMERSASGFVGELIRPFRRVGIYAPGGRAAYPSSVMMAAVPARVAGVGTLALCSPPDHRGEISEAVLAACSVAGIREVYRVGGAQAIAALAYGTETVRPVEKIVGPGNTYVTLAKREVRGWVGIDAEAGPTELVVIADGTAAPEVVAADLVAQAEHGPLGSHVLITWVPELADAVMTQLELVVARHERSEDVENALIEGGRAVLVRDLSHALETANAFAPEHLQLMFSGAFDALDGVRNAGSVFVGHSSAVPVGDYSGGTNHILPAGGTARWSSGLGAQDFVKRVYVSGAEPQALAELAPHIDALSEAEGLPGHARAVRVRLGSGRGLV